MIGKLYRLSITLGDKSYVCDNRNGDDIIIKEFHYWDQASNWIDSNFKKISNKMLSQILGKKTY